LQLGQPGVDVPVPAEFDGDGRADFAVFRTTTAEWLIVGSNSVGRIVQLGQANVDASVPADYDGDGRVDLAVYRPTSATWYAQRTRDGSSAVQFGYRPGAHGPEAHGRDQLRGRLDEMDRRAGKSARGSTARAATQAAPRGKVGEAFVLMDDG